MAGVLPWACNMQSYENPLPVMNLQVHLSEMHMQVLDWMHLLIQIFCRFFLCRQQVKVKTQFKSHLRCSVDQADELVELVWVGKK